MERRDEFKRRRATIALVTHDLDTARSWCDQAMWLDRGRVRLTGDPAMVVEAYRTEMIEGLPRGGGGQRVAGPHIVALAVTPDGKGTLCIPGPDGAGVIAVSTVNVGAPGLVTVSPDTGGARLALNLSICRTESATAACIGAPSPRVSLFMGRNETATFGVFARAIGRVPLDPAQNRVFIRFTGEDGVARGGASVAVYTA
jgi:hypothetical protein